MERLAAIDIGSNAMRLVIGSIDDHGEIKVEKKVREPVRLGQDVFSSGDISKKTIARAIESLTKFRTLMERSEVSRVRAVATSALREASNRDAFVKEVTKSVGLSIDIIDGLEEARLIHSAVAHKVEIADRNTLLMDLGGGSLELTVSMEGKTTASKSFRLGTVRLLQMLSARQLKERDLPQLLNGPLREIASFLRGATQGDPIDFCIGTGGNFECLGKLRVTLLQKNSIYSMTVFELGQVMHHLEAMSIKERVQFLRLRPDRADVIIPAAEVVHAIMRLVPCETLLVPYVGLRDGILADLARRKTTAK